MGVQVKLVMVGPYKGCDKVIKNVPFKNGVAYVRGPEEKIMHILKYLKGYGAYPADEAAAAQAEVDAYLASQADKSAILKRKADLKSELEALEKLDAPPPLTDDEIVAARTAAAEPPPATPAPPPAATEPPATEGEADVKVQNPEAPQQRSGQQAKGGGNSGKRHHGNR